MLFTLFCIVLVMVSHFYSTQLKDSNKYIYIYIYLFIWVTIGPEVAGPMEPDGVGLRLKNASLGIKKPASNSTHCHSYLSLSLSQLACLFD